MLAEGGLLASEAVVQMAVLYVQYLQGDIKGATTSLTGLSSLGSCSASSPFSSSIYLAKAATKLLLASRVLVPVLGAGLICALMALDWEVPQAHDWV